MSQPRPLGSPHRRPSPQNPHFSSPWGYQPLAPAMLVCVSPVLPLILSPFAPDWPCRPCRWTLDLAHCFPCWGLFQDPDASPQLCTMCSAPMGGKASPQPALGSPAAPGSPPLREQPALQCSRHLVFCSVLWEAKMLLITTHHRFVWAVCTAKGCSSLLEWVYWHYFQMKWKKKNPQRPALSSLGYSKQLFTEMTSDIPEKCSQKLNEHSMLMPLWVWEELCVCM